MGKLSATEPPVAALPPRGLPIPDADQKNRQGNACIRSSRSFADSKEIPRTGRRYPLKCKCIFLFSNDVCTKKATRRWPMRRILSVMQNSSEFGFQPQPGFIGIGTIIAFTISGIFNPGAVILGEVFAGLNVNFTALIITALPGAVIVVKRQQINPSDRRG